MLNENVEILEGDRENEPIPDLRTIPGLLLSSSGHWRQDAFKYRENGSWTSVSTDQFLFHVEELFFALRALGVNPGDRIAIVSENRVEWALADYASLCAGAITVPIYPTLSSQEIQTLLQDSDPVAVFFSTPALLEKLRAMRPGRSLRHVVAFDSSIWQIGIMRLNAVCDMGRQSAIYYPGEFRRSILAVEPENIATIIYTSGTTGIPKGAMLTHRNLLSNILATLAVLPIHGKDMTLSFLPSAHVFQRHVDYASFCAGACIAYAENSTAVTDNIVEVRPTFVAGVPRFFEKVYARILSEVSRGPNVRKLIFEKALQAGIEYVRGGHACLAYRAADCAVFRTIRQRLGGRLRFFISGGAPLDRNIVEFFFAVGIPIFEGYGLTETAPVLTLNGPAGYRIGSIGRPVGDVELKIAEDGEILARGSNVMKGYCNQPAESAEALRDGWFHTGDIGEIDADGFVRITDRKKDLIVTSSGKNVAPQPIENRLKRITYFENVVVVGDGRKFLSALIVPDYDALAAYAAAHKIPFAHAAELTHRPEIYDLAMNEIDFQTKDLSPFEKIRKIAFLDEPFSIDGGELTPTMKVRRSAIEKKYKAEIDSLYA